MLAVDSDTSLIYHGMPQKINERLAAAVLRNWEGFVDGLQEVTVVQADIEVTTLHFFANRGPEAAIVNACQDQFPKVGLYCLQQHRPLAVLKAPSADRIVLCLPKTAANLPAFFPIATQGLL